MLNAISWKLDLLKYIAIVLTVTYCLCNTLWFKLTVECCDKH